MAIGPFCLREVRSGLKISFDEKLLILKKLKLPVWQTTEGKSDELYQLSVQKLALARFLLSLSLSDQNIRIW